jgi:DNA-directed RNA polymerase specialized sigma24 family protein
MERKQEPPAQDITVRQLEQQLEALLRDPESADEARRRVRRLDAIRHRQDVLLSEFVHKHAGKLLLLATRLVGPNDAQDVTQEAFVNLTQRLRNKPIADVLALLRSTEDLSRLMYRITVCRAIDLVRARHARKAQVTLELDEQELVGEDAAPLHLDLRIDAAHLEHAYAQLPAEQRIAHVLRYFYEFTDTDFEETLGFTKARTRTLVYRANMTLRRLLERTR